jgi:4-amino-4-deoxy-L-arabinose transferase-like glycosyltransferase
MGKIKTFITKIIEDNRVFWPLTLLTFIFARSAVWLYPFDSDHWIFYYVGRKFAEGGTLYVSAFDHKPPLIFVYNAILHIFFGGNLVYHRIFFTLLALVDIYLFWLLLKSVLPKLNLKKPALSERIALLLYVFFRNISQIANSGNNTENLGIIFFLLMVILFLEYQEKKRLWMLFLAGTCLSILFLLKGNFILLGVPLGFQLLFDNYKKLWKFFLPAFVFVAPSLIHFSLWLAYFIRKKAVYDFVLGTFSFSAKYSKVAWTGNLSRNPNLALSVSIFLLAFIPFVVIYLLNLRKNFIKSPLLCYFLIVSSIVVFGVGPAYPYYFLIVLPVLVLITVLGIEYFKALPGSLRYTIYFVIIVGSAGSFAISNKQIYNTFAGPVRQEHDEYLQIADYVRTNSTPDTKIFNYDYGATFYRLAERDSGSRFISASILLLDYRENFGLGFNDLFKNEMEKTKAKYVVINKDKNNIYYQNKPLIEYFNQNFTPVKEFEHFKVLERK